MLVTYRRRQAKIRVLAALDVAKLDLQCLQKVMSFLSGHDDAIDYSVGTSLKMKMVANESVDVESIGGDRCSKATLAEFQCKKRK